MNTLIRRSVSAAPSLSRQTLASLFSSLCFRTISSTSSEAPSPIHGAGKLGFGGKHKAGFHSGKSLGLWATDVVRAEFAMDNVYEEEKPSAKKGGSDKGLEISNLGIAPEIVSELAKKGITKLFPIQKAVLEPAMQGRDMIGRAKTGTGKTLAFGIPIMDKIMKYNAKHGRGRNPLALVLAPTRELARQVEKEFRESAPLDTLCVYGGVPIQQQMRTLNYGVDVVVGTPGRIIDLLKRGALNLSEVQFLVLDEADQMLAVGFDEDVEIILEKLPPNRQSMMFSATMPSWIRKLTQKHLKNPLTIDLVGENDQKLAEGITLYSIATDNYGKPSILGPLIKEHAKGGKCIVFTQTKRDADRLSYAMSRSCGCEALHGDISQNQRERTLAGFRDGRFSILIATDVAARGLDIPNVDLLPRITAEGGADDMMDIMAGGRTGSSGFGRSGSGFGRGGGGGYGGGYGRPRGSGSFGGSSSGRSSGYGESGRSSEYGESGSERFGSSGGFGSSRSGGFGSFGNSGSGRSGSFGNSGSSRSGGVGFGGSGRDKVDDDW